MSYETFWLIVVLVMGSAVGSFLNVCIVRIPKKLSIVFPASHCPLCEKAIPLYDNIPMVSYILLKGRCRFCRAPISFQYFLVELLTPLAGLLLFSLFGLTWSFLIAFIFTAALIVITFIDFEHQIIPDVISLPGILIGLACSLVVPWTDLISSLVGALAGGGILYAFAAGYYLITRKEGMGGGDIKLLAMIGAFLGWKGALTSLILGALLGSLVGIALMVIKGKNLKYAIPFGPFLSIGAFCALLAGDALVAFYINLGR